ncbi:hypothetical protein AAFC00_001806 [Neodothiora populina]|uniref:Origin recognition complex subunit 3 n=1 Tax=Neodothiora populina TaxID=2781224 RepID=A0ABR3PQ82_9PEZI
MDFETRYVFKPKSGGGTRPSKRRRLEPSGLHTSWPLRKSTFETLWSAQAQRLKDLQYRINKTTVDQISKFIRDTTEGGSIDKILSALVLTGPSIASHSLLFEQLSTTAVQPDSDVFVTLTSSVAPNLKTLLKHLIQKAVATDPEATEEADDDDDGQARLKAKRKPVRLLNYDLCALQHHVQRHRVTRVVVAFQDCEAFDGHLLSEVIELLKCWRDRIPFVFLFGIATTIQDFQSKLSRRATQCISGRRFDVVKADVALEQAFESVFLRDGLVWVGSGVCEAVLRRQRDHIQSLDAFTDSIHYAYMSHFYANALTVFLDSTISRSQVAPDHFKALRHLPSFRYHVHALLEDRQISLVRDLLENDDAILRHVKTHVAAGTSALDRLSHAVRVLHALQADPATTQQTPRSSLMVDALCGQLYASPWERTIMLRLRKTNSAGLRKLLLQLDAVAEEELGEAFREMLHELDQLLQEQTEGNGPLRSEEDLQHSTLRTTVIAKKVELSKQKLTMTKGDSAYTNLLHRLMSTLENYLARTLLDPQTLVFHEIFLYDLKSPLRDVFTPKPRFAIERALAAPHDYLDCACCAPTSDSADESTLSSSQPATAVLYQLYLESGAMINASDLQTAFIAIMNAGEQEEARVKALFQRSLAELKCLGLVRGTRKKADHLMKTSWRGL